MVLHDFLHDSQAQACAVFLALAHKRFEQAFAHEVRNAVSVIGDAHFGGALVGMNVDTNVALFG